MWWFTEDISRHQHELAQMQPHSVKDTLGSLPVAAFVRTAPQQPNIRWFSCSCKQTNVTLDEVHTKLERFRLEPCQGQPSTWSRICRAGDGHSQCFWQCPPRSGPVAVAHFLQNHSTVPQVSWSIKAGLSHSKDNWPSLQTKQIRVWYCLTNKYVTNKPFPR